ncbi:MAG TPA: UDP-N-acetylglucosamine--N-acetylmuramyl-(pentapeptide) pyrophosphoryl-undecaprenol N-acetylglucosamine transferase [Vitreimonas sp.]|nr:UDP-N-acetylglucosamine--N-acetylmuramyl-(pentapeptide) pyrophosphoryl-undecaprenol N-acetylglucosamine transferase [Vitreimonas sp.]
MKILISGGHLTPALALCDYLQQAQPDWKILFVGRTFSQDTAQQKAHEQNEVAKRGLPFFALQAPRLSGDSWWEKIQRSSQFVASVSRALKIISQEKPSVFVSFGGYLAVPIALAAWLKGVPIVTHEQTRRPGRANLFIARLAQKIAISFPETASVFPSHKVVVTGNLLRPELFKLQHPAFGDIKKQNDLPLLYVTGGNQGAKVLNDVIADGLPELIKTWRIIHQCGNATKDHDYLTQLQARKETLTTEEKARYVIREWFTTEELALIYSQATIVLSRAGANTVYELAAVKVPSILVPLPTAYQDEQQANAEWLVKLGGAKLLPQSELNQENLIKVLTMIKETTPQMTAALEKLQIPLDATAQLTDVLKTYQS